MSETKSTTTINEVELFITPMLSEGAENAMHLDTISNLLGWKPSMVKAQVQSERRQGSLICSNKDGYYLPKSIEEIKGFEKLIRAQALSRLVTIKPFTQALKECDTDE